MADAKLIAVTGATGAQGGSVAKYLLEDEQFRVRIITRNPNSTKAKELEARGAEVVQANYNDLGSIREAFSGVYGVFGNTTFFDSRDPDIEIAQGKTLVDAAKDAGVQHFVWSTVDATDPPRKNGQTKVEVNNYLKASGLPCTSLYSAFYFENLESIPLFHVKKAEDGSIVADWPYLWSDGPFAAFAVSDMGAYVREAFKHPETWFGKDLRVASEIITPRKIVDEIRAASGKPINFHEISEEDFEAAKDRDDLQFASELWISMKNFYKNGGGIGPDIELRQSIFPQRKTLANFIRENINSLIPV